jgi:hypothetical protein
MFFVFFMFPFLGVAQKTKSVDIYSIKGAYLRASIEYDSDNAPIDTLYGLFARDGRYTQLVEMVTIYYGQEAALVDFVNYCHKFIKEEEPGTSIIYKERFLSVVKTYGFKLLYIYEKSEDGDGYGGFNEDMLLKIPVKMNEWKNKK